MISNQNNKNQNNKMKTTLSSLHSKKEQAERRGKQEAAKLTARGYPHRFVEVIEAVSSKYWKCEDYGNSGILTTNNFKAVIQEI